MNFNFLEPNLLIYTFFIFITGILAMFTFGRSNKKNKVVFLFIIVFYCLIAGLRSRWVGTDTNSYIYYFEDVRRMNVADIFIEYAARDPLGMVVFKYITPSVNNYTPTLLIIHIIFCFLLAVTYYKYSKNCILAFFVFVFLRYHFFLMSAIRQGFALCLILYSYKYLIKDKFLGFLLFVLFASVFHLSAILCLLFYPIRNYVIYNNGYKILLLVTATIAFSLYIPDFVNLVFSSKTGYLGDSDDVGNLFSLISSFIVFGFIHFQIKAVHVTKEINTLYNLALTYFLLSLLSFKLELAFREAMYFGFMVPIMFTHLTTKASLCRLIVILMFILYSVTGVPISVNPYQFYWDENKIEKNV